MILKSKKVFALNDEKTFEGEEITIQRQTSHENEYDIIRIINQNNVLVFNTNDIRGII